MTTSPTEPPNPASRSSGDGPTVVCVLGMHRSGTSLVARILDLLGASLGPPDRLMPATERNVRGYWEHTEMTEVSEAILERFGGRWHRPPELPPGWEDDPALEELEERAREILREDFGDAPLWAWKDPRLSWTLPWWRRLVTARSVVCVRNPADAARSTVESYAFEKEGETYPLEQAVGLWLQYTAAALRSTAGLPRMVIVHEDLLADPAGEALRLAAFLGLARERAELEGLLAEEVDRSLWHHRSSPGELLDSADVGVAAKALYLALRAAARGPDWDLDAVERFAAECAAADGPTQAWSPAADARRRPTQARREGEPSISIALCTYQGERFLREQLDSIWDQTRPPDELVVCDDGSTDRTLDLLHEYSTTAPFPVRVYVNERRLGSTKNFERAIGLARGDVIALSDQDDVWRPHKLQLVAELFAEAPDLAAVFSDAELIDEQSGLIGERLWERLGITIGLQAHYSNGSPRERVEALTWGNLVTGATLAFRSSYRDLVVPLPGLWVHDAWIGMLLSATAPVRMLGDAPVKYRLHAGQQIGIGVEPMTAREVLRRRRQLVRRATKDERAALLDQSRRLRQAHDRLRECAERYPVPEEALAFLEGKSRHFEVRGRIGTTRRRLPSVFSEAMSGRYRRYSNGWPSVAKDLLRVERLGAK